jgi:Arc/MetJ-type ribon-helix-helix transcriptional regulator
MKTIAITIDSALLRSLDRLAASVPGRRPNRSDLVRRALRDFLRAQERAAREAEEAAILRRHRRRLRREASALVREQARP